MSTTTRARRVESVTTSADGYGRWSATVHLNRTAAHLDSSHEGVRRNYEAARRAARRAIRAELEARGEGTVFRLEWLGGTQYGRRAFVGAPDAITFREHWTPAP